MLCRKIDIMENNDSPSNRSRSRHIAEKSSVGSSISGSTNSNSTKQISNINRMASSYALELQPQRNVSTLTLDAGVTDLYNNGGGFSLITSSSNARERNMFKRGSVTANNANSTNSNSNSQHRRNINIDGANGGEAAGRSCLVIPSFSGIKKKKKRGSRKMGSNRVRPSSSSSATSAESSTGDPFQSNENNDKQSLLNSFHSMSSSSPKNKTGVGGGGVSARDWYLETMIEEGDDDDENNKISGRSGNRSNNSNGQQSDFQHQNQKNSQQQQSQQGSCNSDDVLSTNSCGVEAAPHLLKLPTAEDRGHQVRRQQQRFSGQMHAYQGEMEPEGVRGEEAAVVTATTVTSNSPMATTTNSFSAYEQQQQEQQQPFIATRNFNILSESESSSQLLPISQVVSNRRAHLRSSLLLHEDDEENGDEEEDGDNFNHHLDDQQQKRQQQNSPVCNELISKNSDIVERESFGTTTNPSDNDLDEMVSHNLVEINEDVEEDERSRSQSHSRPAHRQLQQQQQQQQHENEEERVNITTIADATIMTSSQRSKHSITNALTLTLAGGEESLETTSSPKSFRRSAPVNVDDSSFEDPLEHIQGIHAMAMEHVMRGEFDMALQAFSQVLQVYTEQHGQAHPLTASAHHNLGTVHTKRAGLLPEHTLHQRHCREEALKCFQGAARSARDCPTLGPNHPNVAVSLVRIGFLLLQSRQYQNAVITFEEALRIRTDNFGPTHGLVANLYNNLGVCRMHLQNFPEGRKYLQQALDIQKELLNEEDYSSTALLELADTLCNIGGLNLEWIRRQGPDARHAFDAESAFLEALELRSKVLGDEHPLTNQVRSLHDMVRSIPMPKGIAAAEPTSGTRRTSGSTSPASTPGKTTQFSCEYSPAAVSDMTNSIVKSPSINNDRSMMQKDSLGMNLSSSPTRSVIDEQNTSNLSIPVLELPAEESLVTKSTLASASASVSLRVSNNNISAANNISMMDGYEATEENCLLRRAVDDDQSASQTSDFVTYAQMAAAVIENNGSPNNETDRMATMRHAKAVLDSHRDFMDSPARPTTNNDETKVEKTIDERDGSLNEDGLISLAGNWSGPKNNDRLSPDVLQNPSQHLHTIHNCASSYLLKSRQTEAVTLLEMVVECQKAKNGPLHEDVGSAVHNVGVAYLRMEEHYTALQAFEEAIRVRKEALGREHPQVAVSLVKAGISLMLLQRHEDALWIFREALSVRKLALGDLHPSNARIYNNIGCVQVEFDELQEAKKAFESALDIQRNALISNPENGPMIFGASTTLQNLGFLYGKRDMYEKAAMVLRESLSLQERIMYPEHPTVLSTLESLAETCLDARRFSHALKYYTQLFDRSQCMELVNCMKQAATLQTIASINGHLDNPKAQMKKLEMALKFIRSDDDTSDSMREDREALEKKIQQELHLIQGDLQAQEDKWI